MGFTLTDAIAEAVDVDVDVDDNPGDLLMPALDSSGGIRDGAWVSELTHLMDWPARMRLIIRKE